MSVERQLTTMEEEIMVNPQYVQKQVGPQEEDSSTPTQGQTTSSSNSVIGNQASSSL